MRLLLITMNEILFNSLPHIRAKGNVDMDNNMGDNTGNMDVDVDSNSMGNSMDNMVLVLDMGSGYMVVFHLQDLQTQHRHNHLAPKVVLQN
ncbi:hypothetical protein [Priestia megaterium]|uniref:hypothetical protein n=1 Tax=Priestia megaterium TaxID=1404 RepID=UPI001C229BB4|nr:hypothetical protein [Priestia megaterium]MBU8757029.1 hypothetical protein [Priestia megaterium]